MAEMLVFTEDRYSGDIYMDVLRYHRGSVVTIQEDGWPWSKSEQQPPFVVVRVPGVPVEKLAAFIAPDVGFGEPEASKRDRTLRRRAFALDLDAIDAKAVQTETGVQAARLAPPKPIDPVVIG